MYSTVQYCSVLYNNSEYDGVSEVLYLPPNYEIEGKRGEGRKAEINKQSLARMEVN